MGLAIVTLSSLIVLAYANLELRKAKRDVERLEKIEREL